MVAVKGGVAILRLQFHINYILFYFIIFLLKTPFEGELLLPLEIYMMSNSKAKTGEKLQKDRNRFAPREYQLQGPSTLNGNQWIYKQDGFFAFANSAANITSN